MSASADVWTDGSGNGRYEKGWADFRVVETITVPVGGPAQNAQVPLYNDFMLFNLQSASGVIKGTVRMEVVGVATILAEYTVVVLNGAIATNTSTVYQQTGNARVLRFAIDGSGQVMLQIYQNPSTAFSIGAGQSGRLSVDVRINKF